MRMCNKTNAHSHAHRQRKRHVSPPLCSSQNGDTVKTSVLCIDPESSFESLIIVYTVMQSSLSRAVSKHYDNYFIFIFIPQILLIILIHYATCSLNVDAIDSCSKLNQSDFSLTDSGAVIGEKSPLYFLVMAPYPDCPPFNPSWEGGPAVVPAAIVAKDLINQRDDILRDYRIELAVSDSGCNISTKAVNGLIEEVFHSKRNIVGIVGPGCSEATLATATLVTDGQISLIQIAPSATSPALTNTALYPNTFRPIVSALGFVDTYIEFIKQRGYQHVGALYEAGRPFQTAVYTHFQKKARKEEIQLTAVGLLGAHFSLDEFLFNVRIIFVFASSSFAHQLLCLAYHKKMFHTNYQFIFSNRKPMNFFQNVTLSSNGISYRCDQRQMKTVVTGMIFSDFRLRRQDRTENNTHPGISFNEFNDMYTQVRNCRLKMLGLNDTVHTEHHSGYFDATWALALSLNSSLPRLKDKGLSLSNYTHQMSEIIKEELLNLSFEGMTGRIEFSRETHDGANSTIIDVYQVLNTSAPGYSLVGEYNPLLQGSPLKFFHNALLLTQANFDIIYVMPPYFVGGLVVIAAVLLFLLLFACHIAYVVFREYRTIKASSPRLNHLIFAGCYLAIGGTIVYTNTYAFINISEENMALFTIHCIALHWAVTLINPLVFGTLCVKTWRVYCIFYKYNSWLTEYLNDKVLLLAVLLLLGLNVVMNILWNAVNPWHFANMQGSDLQAVAECRTDYQLVWIVVVTLPQGILTMLVVYLAIATRGVHKEEFKETKSINSFLFSLLLLKGACLPLSFILRQGVIHYWCIILSYLCFCLWLLGSVLLCIVFLILPPLIPLIKDKTHMYYRKITLPTPV